MERGHLCQMLEDPHGCLMRWIDDYIYITTSVQKAENFLSHLSQGNEKYGCFISRSKTGVNFASHFGALVRCL
jgi:telomerase reverse transcriptase